MISTRQNDEILLDYIPAISVIVPAYNTQDYLGRCLDSILAQSFEDYEVIFVNDGSSDGSLQVFESYLPRFKRARLVSQDNQGVSRARNAGIAVAKGSYISFIDSDDWIAPSMLQTLYAAITETKSDIAQIEYTTAAHPSKTIVQAPNEVRRLLSSTKALSEMLIDEMYSPCCRLYSRSLMEEDAEVFPVGITCEDRVANFKLISKAEQVVISNRIEYFYYLNYGSISYNGLDERGLDILVADARIVDMANCLGDAHIISLAKDRAAKGAYSLLVKWARFGITDSNLGEDALHSLQERYKKDYPRLMKSQLSAGKKFAAWQLRYMPELLKLEFKLYNILTGHSKESA
ncbi:MAG: glycosyltransferase family 2 protein [Raoultibacter sp.]|jgi:glycosyltransferase involved in cell wall biosynthesis